MAMNSFFERRSSTGPSFISNNVRIDSTYYKKLLSHIQDTGPWSEVLSSLPEAFDPVGKRPLSF